VQRKIGEYEDAIKSYKKALELDKEEVHVWRGLGLTYFDLKNYEEARKCFEKGIELDPKNEGGITSLIELLIIKGDYGEAFEKARANMDLFKTDKYRFLSSFFATVSIALQNKQEEFMEWMNKLLRYLQRAEKPWRISWDFSDIKPTLEQHLKKEDMTLISLLIDVLKEEKGLVELEKELIKKR